MKSKPVAVESETSNKKKEAEEVPSQCPFDFERSRKALIALKKIISTAQQGHKQLLDAATGISLYLHVHKIPRCTYLRLSSQLPHPFTQQETRDVCLFVRDDDVNGREYEATVRRYKSIIEQFKLPFRVDIMTLKQLNQVTTVCLFAVKWRTEVCSCFRNWYPMKQSENCVRATISFWLIDVSWHRWCVVNCLANTFVIMVKCRWVSMYSILISSNVCYPCVHRPLVVWRVQGLSSPCNSRLFSNPLIMGSRIWRRFVGRSRRTFLVVGPTLLMPISTEIICNHCPSITVSTGRMGWNKSTCRCMKNKTWLRLVNYPLWRKIWMSSLSRMVPSILPNEANWIRTTKRKSRRNVYKRHGSKVWNNRIVEQQRRNRSRQKPPRKTITNRKSTAMEQPWSIQLSFNVSLKRDWPRRATNSNMSNKASRVNQHREPRNANDFWKWLNKWCKRRTAMGCQHWSMLTKTERSRAVDEARRKLVFRFDQSVFFVLFCFLFWLAK